MEKNKEWLKKEVEDYLAIEGVYDARTALKAVLEYIDQLDEPNEIELSEPSAWKTIAKLYHPNEVYWGNVRDSYLESLDEPEKVVIPQFVADWIKECKIRKHNLFGVYQFSPEVVSDWILDNESKKERADLIARAWLDGYTIEKEKQYTVVFPSLTGTEEHFLVQGDNGIGGFWLDGDWDYIEISDMKALFTEQEIKTIDSRYWQFAEEVIG